MVFVSGIVFNMAVGQFPAEANDVVSRARLRSHVCIPFTNISMANVNMVLGISSLFTFLKCFENLRKLQEMWSKLL